jgi:hypothetical protein
MNPNEVQQALAEIRAGKSNPAPQKSTLGKVGGFVKDLAVGIVKPVAQTAVQFPRAFASGLAGTAGTIASAVGGQGSVGERLGQTLEQKAQQYAKPVNAPILGEIKPLSAVPGERSALSQLGQAAEMGASVLGTSGAVGAAKQVGKGAIKGAVIEGALTGAEAGGLGGFGSKAQEQGATLGDAAGSGLTGAITGAAIGAPLGLAGGLAGRALSKTARQSRATTELVDLVSPTLNKKERLAALEAGRGVEGFVTRLTPGREADEIAGAVKGIVNPKKSVIQNISALRTGIKNEAEGLMGRLSAYNKAFYSPNELKAALRSTERPLALVGDMDKIYGKAESKFLEFANKEAKNPAGLLKARQKFDDWIEDQIPKIWEDASYKPLHQALRDMRNNANTFLDARVPSAGLKASLKKQSLMYDARYNLAEKAEKDLGKNVFQRAARKYPKLSRAAKYGAALAGGSAVGGFLND